MLTCLIALFLTISSCEYDSSIHTELPSTKYLTSNPHDSLGIQHNNCIDYIFSQNTPYNESTCTSYYFMYNSKPHLKIAFWNESADDAIDYGVTRGYSRSGLEDNEALLLRLFDTLGITSIVEGEECVDFIGDYLGDLWEKFYDNGLIDYTNYNYLKDIMDHVQSGNFETADSLLCAINENSLDPSTYASTLQVIAVYKASKDYWGEFFTSSTSSLESMSKNNESSIQGLAWEEVGDLAIGITAGLVDASLAATGYGAALAGIGSLATGALLKWGYEELKDAMGPTYCKCLHCGAMVYCP